jgi:hypothetical protein
MTTSGEDGAFQTLSVSTKKSVVFADIAAPPMNLLGPELVGDLVALIERAEADEAAKVLVFRSADPEYFISHVDVTQIAEYRQAAARLTGEASIALLFRYLSTSGLITIAQIEGRVRGAGSEFVLACDMRFAARESALFGQPEVGLAFVPGTGAMQHLPRLMGRGRALEVLLSSETTTRGSPSATAGSTVRWTPTSWVTSSSRSRSGSPASPPRRWRATAKDRVGTTTLASADEFRRDSDLFGERASETAAQTRTQAAMRHGFQTPDGELALARMLDDLGDGSA